VEWGGCGDIILEMGEQERYGIWNS
jgi:hypothetical protein